jgi:hypothetical protein
VIIPKWKFDMQGQKICMAGQKQGKNPQQTEIYLKKGSFGMTRDFFSVLLLKRLGNLPIGGSQFHIWLIYFGINEL